MSGPPQGIVVCLTSGQNVLTKCIFPDSCCDMYIFSPQLQRESSWPSPLGMKVTGPPDICTCSLLLLVRGARSRVDRAPTILKSWYRKYCFTATNNHTVAPLDICTCSILGKGARSSGTPPPVLFDNSHRMAARANNNCEVVLCSTSTHSEGGGRSDLWQNNWVSLENLEPTLQRAHYASSYYILYTRT